MSGTRPTSAEQHLGDRLAALVDGELSHDVRERVLSHLATCAKCKAEADAQRRLKSVFSTAAPPPPSEGLLARLQGLPGGGPGGRDGDDDPAPFGRGGFGQGVFGADPRQGRSGRPGSSFDFDYVPAAGHTGVLPGAAPWRGFRIHDVGRAEAERSGGRGRRLAFAAASAVSLAAFALGGAMPVGSAGEPTTRGGSSGNNVTPLRAAGPSGAATENTRRRTAGSGLPAATASANAAANVAVPARLFGAATTQGGAQGLSLTQPFPAPALTAQSPLPLIRRPGSALALAYAPGHSAPVTVAPSPLRTAAPSAPGLPVSR
ncbi:hypothetical protein AR457_12525 [Streptomyces agglomeratus]|uniref:Putative zinc-finger domain-containing protein n=1 Tax=Streptomyces agglomeratus TaxID=285458 RepID=A0A1E5P6H6_9ACTN|nr:zf-HC2 domain-containing protein [Streptomyces agglomeratus]OEJ25160.1 hypothetical protein AS594_12375 [Streptomyces agglomeratus]OEJ40811.1 hypothetical protein BGK70_24125 [Streptomyces agglomeratus]OEJ44808.1 hypothetical protein AR457_12525 [Streptomyces agglomeratus]OEJ53351.1 hypothetical protein BGK72_23725 [Streptomyces agglomeratus]OEJ60688.1 hypothetical protein BGM19_24435 [Streptomyces agglomeratus]